MGLAEQDGQRHNYAEYLTWPDDARYELVDGAAYLMAPAPALAHQDIAREIYRQLANALSSSATPCRPFIAPVDVRLPKVDDADDRIDTVVQPDVLVVCDPNKLDRRGVRGAPDLVVEVLSPNTAFHDSHRKRQVYERAGVREYWLVHPSDRIVTIYRLEQGRFGRPEVQELNGETSVSLWPDIRIRWNALVARLPPPEP